MKREQPLSHGPGSNDPATALVGVNVELGGSETFFLPPSAYIRNFPIRSWVSSDRIFLFKSVPSKSTITACIDSLEWACALAEEFLSGLRLDRSLYGGSSPLCFPHVLVRNDNCFFRTLNPSASI
jgi:hypothetical protein